MVPALVLAFVTAKVVIFAVVIIVCGAWAVAQRAGPQRASAPRLSHPPLPGSLGTR